MPTLRPVRAGQALPLCTLAALLFTTPVLSAQSAADQRERKAVMAVVTTLFDGMRAGDSTMVRTLFDPRVRMITVAQRAGRTTVSVDMGADRFVNAVGTPRGEVWDERIANEKVEIDGAVASVWVDYGFFRGSTFSHCGIDHFLLVCDEAGSWKILELADTRRSSGCERWTK